MRKTDSVILVISDIHFPYHHRDTFDFLEAIKREYKPTRIINIGDEVDNHAISFHLPDPDLSSPGDELKKAQDCCKELESIFPEMELLHSNHGSLAYRRGKASGIPRHMIKEYNDILHVGPGWKWEFEIKIRTAKDRDILFRHQFNTNIGRTVERLGCCCVQGHYHSKFEIVYASNPRSLNWGMTVGNLADHRSLAMEYNKLQVQRPILGCGIIIDGFPRLLPMYLSKNHRWDRAIH